MQIAFWILAKDEAFNVMTGSCNYCGYNVENMTSFNAFLEICIYKGALMRNVYADLVYLHVCLSDPEDSVVKFSRT